MMIAYVNLFNQKFVRVKVSDLIKNLERRRSNKYSPMDVIDDPDKYPDDYNKIKNADLSMPIFIVGDDIVDGIKRFAKAYINKEKTIRAYIFSNKLLGRFLIDKKGDWDAVDKMEIYDYIELFHKRFT